MGLARASRITQELFLEVLERGRRGGNALFSVRYMALGEPGASRFAFVAPKTYSKKAVIRNTLRRRGREIIRRHQKQIKPGYAVIFFAKGELVKKNFSEMEKNILEILRTSNLRV